VAGEKEWKIEVAGKDPHYVTGARIPRVQSTSFILSYFLTIELGQNNAVYFISH